MSGLIKGAMNLFRNSGSLPPEASKPKSSEQSGKHISTDFKSSSSITTETVFEEFLSDGESLSSEGFEREISGPDSLPETPKASMEKTNNCVTKFFKGLLKNFQKAIDQHTVKQMQIQHREQIKENTHSGKLAQTLNKFLGKAKSDQEGGKYQYQAPKLTQADVKNLNDYFSEDKIEPGLDALVDLYNAGQKDEFKNILLALSQDNFTKVENNISQVEDEGKFETVFFDVRNEKISVQDKHMADSIDQLKSTSKPEDLEKSIEAIRSLALQSLPSNSSEELKENVVAQAFTKALGKLNPISDHAEANQALSFKLGQLILKPMNGPEDTKKACNKIGEWIQKGKTNTLGNCGKDLFRFSPRIDMFGKNGDQIVDRSPLKSLRGDEKTRATGSQMVRILNEFYRENSGEDIDLITEEDLKNLPVNDQGGAMKLAEKLPSLMSQKNINPLHQDQIKNFLGVMGMQEIPTRVGDWSIPGGSRPDDSVQQITNAYKSGHGDLKVSEFSAAYTKIMSPLEYERTQSFTIRSDGKYELKIYNPITFADTSDATQIIAVGTCGVVSRLVFDENMTLETMTQEVVPAKLSA